MTPLARSSCSTHKDENGKTVPAAAEAGKIGNVFIVNRLTGKLLHKSDAFVKQADNMFIIPGRHAVHPLSRHQWRQSVVAGRPIRR